MCNVARADGGITSESDDIWHAETDYDIIRLVNKNRRRAQYYELFGVLTIHQFYRMDGDGDDDNGEDGALFCCVV